MLADPVENMGAQLLKEAAAKTNETAGDGTTTAVVLAQSILQGAFRNITAGAESMARLKPSAVVIVATVRALKYHGGVPKAELNHENLEALEKGLPNLLQHVGNIKNVFGLPCVVAINAFPTDTAAELKMVEEKCRELGVNVALSEVWAKGGEGGKVLAEEVVRLCDQPNNFHQSYELDMNIGLEHTAELGNTLLKIAREKAGIIKAGGTVVTYPVSPETDELYDELCAARGAKRHGARFDLIREKEHSLSGQSFDWGEYRDVRIRLLGPYQLRNTVMCVFYLFAIASSFEKLLRSSGISTPPTALPRVFTRINSKDLPLHIGR